MTRILIVDDEATIRNGLNATIPWEENGFVVAGLAKNGMEALEFYRDNHADIVISDIKMPQMDGIELLRCLHTEHPHIAFVFISGYDEFEFAQKAVNNGAFGYLLKPIDVSELLEILARARVSLLKTPPQSPVKDEIRDYNGYHSVFSSKDRIIDLLLTGLIPEARETLFSQLKHMQELQLPLGDVKQFCRNLLYAYLHALTESGLSKDTFAGLETAPLFLSMQAPEMLEHLYHLLLEINSRSFPMHSKNIDKLIGQAKQYVGLHYSNPYLTMPDVAAHIGFNPSYFSAEFTKHESLCFVDYLTNLRISHAKQLLARSDDKIQSISETVGYMNATYFSTLFKRAVGMTPSQYRSELQGGSC